MILNTSILKQILVALGGDPDYGDNSVATERKIVNAVGGNGNDYGDNEAALLKRWLLQIGGTPVYSDNEDRTLGKILEKYGGGLGVFLNPTGKLEAILGKLNSTPLPPPVLLSATINASGDTITLVFSEPMIGTSGFIESFESFTLSYLSGEGTNTYTLSATPTIAKTYSLTLNYNPGDMVGAQSGLPLADIAVFPMTNNSVWDADALDFISRASLSDSTQKSAVNTLTVDLKAASLWSKISALYPFVGGNATAHSKNLKADAFNITWSGTVTQDSEGAQGDGISGYGDTGLVTDGAGYVNNLSFGYRVNLAGVVARNTVAAHDGSIFAAGYHSDGTAGTAFVRNTSNSVTGSNSSATGLHISTRVSAGDHKFFFDGAEVGSEVAAQGTLSSTSWKFFTLLPAGGFHSDMRVAFAFWGTGLTPADVAAITAAELAFQTSIGRTL